RSVVARTPKLGYFSIGSQNLHIEDVNTLPGPIPIADRDLVDGIDDLHAVHHTPKGGIGTVQMVRTRGGHHNKELIGGCEFMGVVPFTAGHVDGAPVVAMPLSGIGGKQIPAYVRPYFHDLGIVGTAPLNEKILYHPMELRTIK